MSLAAVMMGEARVRAGGTRNGGEKCLSYRCALLKEFSKCARCHARCRGYKDIISVH